jgi:indole-3-glycerol phosphate synthase
MLLDPILACQRQRIAYNLEGRRWAALRERALSAEPPRPFGAQLRQQYQERGVALKQASPSRGRFWRGDLCALAHEYEVGGAAAVSVVTQAQGFEGSLTLLAAAREVTTLPALRKDFLLHPVDVWESRAWGADAVLLIAAVLEQARLEEMAALAHSLGMGVLIEVAAQEEMTRVRNMRETLIGINNRCLQTFVVRTQRTQELAPLAGPGAFLVSESGLRTPEDVRAAVAYGASAVLVGESIVRDPRPGQKVAELAGACAKSPRPLPSSTAVEEMVREAVGEGHERNRSP